MRAIQSARFAPLWESDSSIRQTLMLLPRHVVTLDHGRIVETEAAAFSPDGRFIATGSVDDTARVFEAFTGKEIWRRPLGGSVVAVAFSPDGQYVAAGTADSSVGVFEASNGRQLWQTTLDRTTIFDVRPLVFSPDGRFLGSGDEEGTFVLMAATGKQLWRVAEVGAVNELTFSSDGRLVATASADRTARLFEAATGKQRWQITLAVDFVVQPGGGRRLANVDEVAFSSDAHLIATANEDGS